MSVKLTRGRGHWFAVAGLEKATQAALESSLTFLIHTQLQGYAAKIARQEGRGLIDSLPTCSFDYDNLRRMIVPLGFRERVESLLRAAGVAFSSEFDRPAAMAKALTPDYAAVGRLLADAGREFRHRQDELIATIAAFDTGRIDCPPGYGKSFCIALACAMFPLAKIAVVSDRVPVIRDTIYRDLCSLLPNVGMVGGGIKVLGRRIMCATTDSSHHLFDTKPDLVLIDEGHEFASDDAVARITNLTSSHCTSMHAFSASWEKRPDGRDYRYEALFGPVRMKVGYAEAQDHGMVVPIRVQMRPVLMDEDPCFLCRDDERERFAVWANDTRNTLIAADAREAEKRGQVMISVRTVEHGLRLRELLPDYEVVYAEGAPTLDLRRRLAADGIELEGLPEMTTARRKQLKDDAESGTLRKFIANGVFNVGVNFVHLRTLIRADASGSPVMDTQVPGRVSRVGDGSKEVGTVYDYFDCFNRSYLSKSKGRMRMYASHGWTVDVLPGIKQKEPARGKA